MATPWSMFAQGQRPAWAPPVFKTPFGVRPVPVPVPMQAPVSRPVGGPNFMDAITEYLNMGAGPMNMGPAGPQRGNEMRISYGGRRAGNAAGNAMLAATPNLLPALVQGGKEVAGSVANAFDYMTATPDSDLRKAFGAMIMQESGGDQSAVSKKGAIGVAQVMPGTGPEAAKLAGLPWDPQKYRNDPAYNAAIGFAYFKEKVRENKGDVFKGMAAYNAGQGRVQQAERRAAKTGQPWTAFIPPETQQYLPKVLQNMGQLASAFGTPPPAFNAAPYQQAMAAQDQAAQLLSTPFSVDMQYQPLPERPKPTELAAPDFAAGNAAFEAARPVNPFNDPKEKVRVQRQQYFKGIGQAMASLSGGEGIGTMLMKIGAGALMGRGRGDEMIDAKEEEFERNMQQFNLALASRNDQQAVTSANILNQNIAQRNQYAEAVWQDNIQQINKFQPQVQGNNVVSFTPDPSDPNKKTMTVTPLGYGIQAEAILNKSQIGLQMGQAEAAAGQFAYQSQQATSRTALGIATQFAVQQGNGQAAQEGYLTEAANRARATVRAGNWRDLFGNDTSNITGQLDEHAKNMAYQQLGTDPELAKRMPLTGSALARFQELYEDNLTSSIYEMALKAGTVDKLFTMAPAHSAYTSQRGKQQRESQRVDSRGRTSFTTSWDMGE